MEEGTKHTIFRLTVEGRKTGYQTFISRGSTEVSDNLLAAMARQLGLRTKQFSEYVDCTFTREDHLGVLREAGEI